MPIDLKVVSDPESSRWKIVDLLGRPRGEILRLSNRSFMIDAPAGTAMEAAIVNAGPHKTLDAAIEEIETRMRATCRRQD